MLQQRMFAEILWNDPYGKINPILATSANDQKVIK